MTVIVSAFLVAGSRTEGHHAWIHGVLFHVRVREVERNLVATQCRRYFMEFEKDIA